MVSHTRIPMQCEGAICVGVADYPRQQSQAASDRDGSACATGGLARGIAILDLPAHGTQRTDSRTPA
jgi:hypothetical protein